MRRVSSPVRPFSTGCHAGSDSPSSRRPRSTVRLGGSDSGVTSAAGPTNWKTPRRVTAVSRLMVSGTCEMDLSVKEWRGNLRFYNKPSLKTPRHVTAAQPADGVRHPVEEKR